MGAILKLLLAIFLIGLVIDILEKYGIFIIIGIVVFVVLYIWLKKKGYIKPDDPASTTAEKSIQSRPIRKDIPSAPETHPSSLPGGYSLAYHYDEVKFYPPTEMVSKINSKLVHPGAEVTLKPEPKNEYDSRAIALYVSKQQIGYLLRGTLQDMVHDYIAQKRPIKATLLSLKQSGGEYQGRIALSFYRKTEEIPAKRLGYSDIDIHAIHPTDPNVHPNTPLTGMNIVFSGVFALPIDAMMQKAVDAGATLRTRVTKNTNYLVVGAQGQDYVDENGLSSKEATATKLIEAGEANIKIIDEKTFLELAQDDVLPF